MSPIENQVVQQEASFDHTESLTDLSQAELLARRDEVNAKLAEVADETGRLSNRIDDDEAQVVATLSIAYGKDQQADDTAPMNEMQYIVTHGAGILSDETLQIITALDACQKGGQPLLEAESNIEAELDTKYGEELSDYVRLEARKLLARTDRQLIRDLARREMTLPDSDGMALHDNERTMPRPEDAMATLQDVVHSLEETSYQSAELAYDTVERSREILERWGALRHEPQADRSTDRRSIDEQATLNQLVAAYELNRTYRVLYHNEVLPIDALHNTMLPMYEWTVKPTDDERASLTRHLRSIDVTQEVNRLALTGLDLLPFAYSEQALRAFLMQMPAIAFEGVTGVDFMYMPEDEKQREVLRDGVSDQFETTLGYHRHDLQENKARITIYIDYFVNRYERSVKEFGQGPVSEAMGQVMRWELEATIAHEVGHALHTTLPASMLRDWDSAARAEDVDVSEYTERVRAANGTASPKYAWEDFADTFMIFYSDNEQLSALQDKAPVHYRAMHDILQRTTAP